MGGEQKKKNLWNKIKQIEKKGGAVTGTGNGVDLKSIIWGFESLLPLVFISFLGLVSLLKSAGGPRFEAKHYLSFVIAA